MFDTLKYYKHTHHSFFLSISPNDEAAAAPVGNTSWQIDDNFEATEILGAFVSCNK